MCTHGGVYLVDLHIQACTSHTSVYLTGVHLTGVHLIGVYLAGQLAFVVVLRGGPTGETPVEPNAGSEDDIRPSARTPTPLTPEVSMVSGVGELGWN
jgi:hypothetical protein